MSEGLRTVIKERLVSFHDKETIKQLQSENDRQAQTIKDYQGRIKELEESLSVQELTREEQANYFAKTLKLMQIKDSMIKIFQLISVERESQDAKWGDQRHKANSVWYVILGEEFGEVGRALLDENIVSESPYRLSSLSYNYLPRFGEGKEALIEELVQVAAVAVAWLEALNG